MRPVKYIVGLILALGLFMGISEMTSVKAASMMDDPDYASDYNALSGLEKSAYGLYEYMISPPEYIQQFLYMDDDGSGTVGVTASNVIQSGGLGKILALMKILASYLLIIYFLLEVDKLMLASGGEFNIKGFFYLLMKAGLGVYIVTHIDDIISWGFALNDSAMDYIKEGEVTDLTAQIAAGRAVMAQLQEQNLFETIGSMLLMVLGVIGTAIGNLLLSFQCVSRKIELIGRGLFLPLAVSDTYKGMDSNGWRYLKKYGACALCGIGFMAVINIGSSLQAQAAVSSDIGTLSSIFLMVVIPLSLGGAASAMKQVINDALGV